MRLRFGPFVLDSGTRQLLADGEPRRLTPKAFALLELLVEERPRAVTKREIIDRLWPRTFVAESNVASLVNEVREALADDPHRPRYLRTVHRFGYAFCGDAAGEVARRASPLEFRVISERQDFALQAGENVLGRGSEAAVRIDHSSVSRRHALVRIEAERAEIEDCQSKNGTFVRGHRVTQPQALADRDEIRLGHVRLVFRILGADQVTATVSPFEP